MIAYFMRTLSIDFGSARIGLAISDAGGTLATPLEVIPSDAEAVSKILAMIQRESVEIGRAHV